MCPVIAPTIEPMNGTRVRPAIDAMRETIASVFVLAAWYAGYPGAAP
jgi:hypothetical protein